MIAGWMSGNVESHTNAPPKPVPRENKYKPAWSTVNNERTQPLLAPQSSYQPKENDPGGGGGCIATLKKIFCSFRTSLVPALIVVFAASLFSFILRLQLHCSWNVWWLQTFSLANILLAFALIYGIIKGANWLCAGWFVSLLFSLGSVIIAICEWVNEMDDCHDSTKTQGASVSSWTIPTATTLLIFLWALSAHLFNKGSKEIKEENDPSGRQTSRA